MKLKHQPVYNDKELQNEMAKSNCMVDEAYLMVHCVTWYLRTAHEWALVLVWELLVWLPCCVGDTTGFLSSPPGVGGASFLGGILSLIASSPFASANDVILWFGEKPCRAENIKGFHYVSSQIIKWQIHGIQSSLSNKIIQSITKFLY
jgi:hypothetical protein